MKMLINVNPDLPYLIAFVYTRHLSILILWVELFNYAYFMKCALREAKKLLREARCPSSVILNSKTE